MSGIRDIVSVLRQEEKLTVDKANRVLKVVFAAIPELAKGDGLVLRGFGSFRYKTKKERKGQNFKGETITIPESTKLAFTASKGE